MAAMKVTNLCAVTKRRKEEEEGKAHERGERRKRG